MGAPREMTAGRLRPALAVLLGLALVAGCAQKEAEEAAYEPGPAGEEMAAPAAPMAERAADKTGGGTMIAATGDTESALAMIAAAEAAESRKVIKSADLDVEVRSLEGAQRQVVELVEQRGGFIASMTVSDYDTWRQSEIVARVPSEHFRAVYDAVKALGEVERDHIGGQDVTEEYMDLERRIANKQAEETRLREMFAQARTVDDLLKVEQRLSEVRMEIESYQGRLRFLKDQVRYSTLTITLSERPEAPLGELGGWKLGYHLVGAWRALVNAVRAIVVALIYIALPGAVVWLPLLIIILLIRRAVIRRRAKRETVPPPAQ
ncbi:MAG: DUF4349 domain-containing protein [Armatimonadota bacterium]